MLDQKLKIISSVIRRLLGLIKIIPYPVTYNIVHLDKSKMEEYSRKAAADAARWNALFNKEKRDERRCVRRQEE